MLGVIFYDEMTGEPPQDMGVNFKTAEEAERFAKGSWEDAGREGGFEYAADLKFEGFVGTAAYEASFGPGSAVDTFTVTYTIYQR